MRLQRALGDRGAVALVLEVLVQLAVVDDAARRRHVALLHRQHDVVVERLRAALDEQVVRGQAGAADAEALAPDDVLDVVGDALLALRLRDRLEVLAVGLEHRLALVVLEPADAGAVGEAPRVALERGRRLEQVEPRVPARVLQELAQQPVGRVEREAELLVAVAGRERAHLVDVGAAVGDDHLLDRLVGERVAEAEQGQARGHPLQVPRVVAEVGLVEVVDVEHEDPGGVHVGAVVLGVQVALDPDAARALVDPRVLEPGDVVVEQHRRAAVERERVGGHLAELAPERARIGLDQLLERGDEDLRDALLALTGVADEVLDGRRPHRPYDTAHDRPLHPPRARRGLDRRGAHDGVARRRGRGRRGARGRADARGPRRDPRRDVHRRGGQGARGRHRPRRGGVRRRAVGLRRARRALDPLRADVLRRARHRARAADPPRGRADRRRRARAGDRARRARARVRRHAVRRAHPRRPRRADDVRAQARGLRVRGPPQRRAAGACVRPGRRRRDLRRRRHPRRPRPRLRGARAGAARAAGRGHLDAGRPARPPRRAAAGDRARRRGPRALRDRDPPPPAHGGARGRGAVPRRPEGLERDAAQAQPDHDRAHHRPRAGAARLLAGGARERGAVARARHLALRRRARDPARRDDPARLHAAPRAAGRVAA